MKTRRFFLAMAVIAFVGMGTTTAQNVNTGTQNKKYTTEELVAKRVQRMQTQLKMDDATTAKFTPLYKEYLQELGTCHKNSVERCKLNSDACTDADRINRIENHFDCQQNMLNIRKEYYTKFKKILNAQQLESLFCNHRQFMGRKFNKNYQRGNYGNCDLRGANRPHHHERCIR